MLTDTRARPGGDDVTATTTKPTDVTISINVPARTLELVALDADRNGYSVTDYVRELLVGFGALTRRASLTATGEGASRSRRSPP